MYAIDGLHNLFNISDKTYIKIAITLHIARALRKQIELKVYLIYISIIQEFVKSLRITGASIMKDYWPFILNFLL